MMHGLTNLNTLHVSDGLSVRHHEFKIVHTGTGICYTDTVIFLLAGTRWNSCWFYYGNILQCTAL
jgi:hypothetical protein